MFDAIDAGVMIWIGTMLCTCPLMWLAGWYAGRKKRESDFQRMAKASRWAYAPKEMPVADFASLDAHMAMQGWKRGHILSDVDVSDIGLVLNELEVIMEQDVDSFMAGRKDAAVEIGGQDLLDALMSRDEKRCREAVNKAVNKFHREQEKRI